MIPYVEEYLNFIKANSGRITLGEIKKKFLKDNDVEFHIEKMCEGGYINIRNGLIHYITDTSNTALNIKVID